MGKNKKENLEVNSYLYGPMILSEEVKATQWGKDSLFNK